MPRSKAIFEWVFGMKPGNYELQFEATPNEGLNGSMLTRRMEKEAADLESLRAVIRRIRDLRSLHHWINTEHLAYTAEGWSQRRASSPELVEIY
jgi:hypothetical protein